MKFYHGGVASLHTNMMQALQHAIMVHQQLFMETMQQQQKAVAAAEANAAVAAAALRVMVVVAQETRAREHEAEVAKLKRFTNPISLIYPNLDSTSNIYHAPSVASLNLAHEFRRIRSAWSTPLLQSISVIYVLSLLNQPLDLKALR